MKKHIFRIIIVVLGLLYTIPSFAGGQPASGKTAANLTTEVRYIINEATAAHWTDAEITAWINQAVHNIVNRTHCLESGITRHVLSSGTSEYPIGADYFFVKGVVHQSGVTSFKTLKKGKILELGNITGDEPASFYEFNGKVGIYPMMDSEYHRTTGTTIYVLTVTKPSTLTSSSSIPTPAAFDRAIIYYAACQAFLKDGEVQKATWYLNQYYAEIDRFRLDILDWEQSIWEMFYGKPQPKANQ